MHNRQEHWNDQKDYPDPIHKRTHEEQDQHHHQQNTHGGHIQPNDEICHILRTASDRISTRQRRSPDRHPDNRTGRFEGAHQAFPHEVKTGLPPKHGNDKHRDHTHARRFRDAGYTSINGAQHNTNDDNRRNQTFAHIPTGPCTLNAEGKEDQCKRDGGEPTKPGDIIRRTIGNSIHAFFIDVLSCKREKHHAQKQSKREARCDDRQEGSEKRPFFRALRVTRFWLWQGRLLWIELSTHNDVKYEHHCQHEARHECAREQCFDRGFSNQAIDDQHNGRRDHCAQRA